MMSEFSSPFIVHDAGVAVEKTKRRLGLARYHVVKDGIVLGFHRAYEPASKLASFLEAEVVDTKL